MSSSSSRKRPSSEILNRGVEITKEITSKFFIVKVPKVLATQLEAVGEDEEIGVFRHYSVDPEQKEKEKEDEMIMMEDNDNYNNDNVNKKRKVNNKTEKENLYEVEITNPALLHPSRDDSFAFRPDEYVMKAIERPEEKELNQNIYGVIEDEKTGRRYFIGTAVTPMYSLLPKSTKIQKHLIKSLTKEQNQKRIIALENVGLTENTAGLRMIPPATSSLSSSSPFVSTPMGISNMEMERQFQYEQQNPKRKVVNLEELAQRSEQNQQRGQSQVGKSGRAKGFIGSGDDSGDKMKIEEEGNKLGSRQGMGIGGLGPGLTTAANTSLAVSTKKTRVTNEDQAQRLIFDLFEKEDSIYTVKNLRRRLEEKGYIVAEKLVKTILNGTEGGAEGICTYMQSGPYRYHYHLNARFSKCYAVGDRVKLINQTIQVQLEDDPNFPRNAVYIIGRISPDGKYGLVDTADKSLNQFFEAFEIYAA